MAPKLSPEVRERQLLFLLLAGDVVSRHLAGLGVSLRAEDLRWRRSSAATALLVCAAREALKEAPTVLHEIKCTISPVAPEPPEPFRQPITVSWLEWVLAGPSPGGVLERLQTKKMPETLSFADVLAKLDLDVDPGFRTSVKGALDSEHVAKAVQDLFREYGLTDLSQTAPNLQSGNTAMHKPLNRRKKKSIQRAKSPATVTPPEVESDNSDKEANKEDDSDVEMEGAGGGKEKVDAEDAEMLEAYPQLAGLDCVVCGGVDAGMPVGRKWRLAQLLPHEAALLRRAGPVYKFALHAVDGQHQPIQEALEARNPDLFKLPLLQLARFAVKGNSSSILQLLFDNSELWPETQSVCLQSPETLTLLLELSARHDAPAALDLLFNKLMRLKPAEPKLLYLACRGASFHSLRLLLHYGIDFRTNFGTLLYNLSLASRTDAVLPCLKLLAESGLLVFPPAGHQIYKNFWRQLCDPTADFRVLSWLSQHGMPIGTGIGESGQLSLDGPTLALKNLEARPYGLLHWRKCGIDAKEEPGFPIDAEGFGTVSEYDLDREWDVLEDADPRPDPANEWSRRLDPRFEAGLGVHVWMDSRALSTGEDKDDDEAGIDWRPDIFPHAPTGAFSERIAEKNKRESNLYVREDPPRCPICDPTVFHEAVHVRHPPSEPVTRPEGVEIVELVSKGAVDALAGLNAGVLRSVGLWTLLWTAVDFGQLASFKALLVFHDEKPWPERKQGAWRGKEMACKIVQSMCVEKRVDFLKAALDVYRERYLYRVGLGEICVAICSDDRRVIKTVLSEQFRPKEWEEDEAVTRTVESFADLEMLHPAFAFLADECNVVDLYFDEADHMRLWKMSWEIRDFSLLARLKRLGNDVGTDEWGWALLMAAKRVADYVTVRHELGTCGANGDGNAERQTPEPSGTNAE